MYNRSFWVGHKKYLFGLRRLNNDLKRDQITCNFDVYVLVCRWGPRIFRPGFGRVTAGSKGQGHNFRKSFQCATIYVLWYNAVDYFQGSPHKVSAFFMLWVKREGIHFFLLCFHCGVFLHYTLNPVIIFLPGVLVRRDGSYSHGVRPQNARRAAPQSVHRIESNARAVTDR